MKQKKKNKEIITVGLVLLLVIVIVGVSYAAFTFSKTGVTENAITTSAVTMIYTEGDNQISINNAVPMTEEVGKTLSDENYVFDFTIDIKTGPKMPISYEVTAVKDSSSTMENEDVRLYLQKSLDGTNYNEEVLEPSPYTPLDVDDEFGAKAGEMVMDVGTVSEKVTYYYRLRMWVDSSYELSSEAKSFTVRINAYGKEGGYRQEGDPASPEIVEGIIPVIYDEENSTWVKSSTNQGEWYDYDNQMWANAVTIKDNTKRGIYKNADVGAPVAIEDINAFMVWIPRYSYTLGNTYGYQIEGAETPSRETPGAFDIKFVDKNTIDMGSGQYTGDTPENYFTPSSFCWGDTCDDEATRKDPENIELAGIWVSKFSLTYENNIINSIPNVSLSSLTNVANTFSKIQTIMNGGNGLTNYGFSGNYDTHMIKNTEWGAFTYLSQSKYGKYGNKNYKGKEKLIYHSNTNPNLSINGCSWGEYMENNINETAPTEITCRYKYNVIGPGTGASTTGTIYGIYGTAGSHGDYVMGNYKNYVAKSTWGSTGFAGLDENGNKISGIPFPSRKYYNLYTGSVGIKGDATNADFVLGFGENSSGSQTSFSDFASLNNSNHWLMRGEFASAQWQCSPFSLRALTGIDRVSTRFVMINY